MVYISGYCLMDRTAPRFDATTTILRELAAAKRGGPPFVVFDVVPHRLYDRLSLEEFLALSRGVEVLISEAATMRRFLGLGSRDELVDDTLAEEALRALKALFPRLVLRFGPSGCDDELLWDGTTERAMRRATGHSQATDRRGFGDRLALDALSRVFGILPVPSLGGAGICSAAIRRTRGTRQEGVGVVGANREVRVTRFLAVHDSGRVMDRLTYENQVFGGVTMGIGFALTESRVLGRQMGRDLNANLHDYRVPTALDVPAEMA